MEPFHIVYEGLDLSGKGVAINANIEYLRSIGKKVYDGMREEMLHPSTLEELAEFDVIVTAEPTFFWGGLAIRNEITKNNGRYYPAFNTGQHYGGDREVLHVGWIDPLKASGKSIIEDRCYFASLVYQLAQAESQGEYLTAQQLGQILGNQIAMESRADAFIFTDCPAEECMRRKAERKDKQDDSWFERSARFLGIVEKYYNDESVRKIVLAHTVQDPGIITVDANVSPLVTGKLAVDAFKQITG